MDRLVNSILMVFVVVMMAMTFYVATMSIGLTSAITKTYIEMQQIK